MAGTPKRLNVLLLEDDELDVMNVKRAFKRNEMEDNLWVAGDGVAGLEMLRSSELPRERLLILLDLNMPRMNGIEFLQELRKDPNLHRTPVVVLTTSNDERDLVDAYELNVAGYIIKPVTFEKFVEVVGTMNDYWSLVEMPSNG
jgi:CheY-like chemotaxis protein